ncbi:M20/M25/M40 family metallo-hydrolase [Brachybacterium tyrofermentans]|uniref:M20/M25/M40 family metallo-hydrolase n=1 Tax=Brachybacterium tyrofermentans TaxID=47848 RepID=UPI003FD43C4E
MTNAKSTGDTLPDEISPGLATAQDEVVDLCRTLIRFDTSNPTRNELKAAQWVREQLEEVGLSPELIESEPGRASVVCRVPGVDRERGGLLLHAHLDVVPAEPSDWTHPPFEGVIEDGYLWGRGAIDMKDTVAVFLAVARHLGRTGMVPPRDLVFLFVADEEGGGVHGSKYLVKHRPDFFDGVTEAIGEGGGFSFPIDDNRRLYPIENAQRGQAWLRLTATGRAGHGSSPNSENAVTRIADAISAIGHHEFAYHLVDSVRGLATEYARLRGIEFDSDDVAGSLDRLGPDGHELLDIIVRNSANPTMTEAGYQINVIPGRATAAIDGRFLPGQEEAFLEEIDSLLPEGVTREFVHRDFAMETPFEGRLVDAMQAAILAEDEHGSTASYCNPGGTDAKAFSTLGIRCFGFKALKLPHDLEYVRLFHGVDERVPLEGLLFGVRVIGRLVLTA